jgi:small-conductance mechanosensitive channel
MSLSETPLFKQILEIWNITITTVDKNAITVGTIIIGLSILIFGYFASKYFSKKILKKLLTKTDLDISYRATIESLTFYTVLVFFMIFAMRMANIPLTIFTVFGGAIAIGVGFGSQNVINNFISGLILMFERPVKVGDYVEVDGVFGKVDKIGMRSTHILSFGNKHMILPNSSFLEKNVLNWTLSDRFARISVKVGICYGADTEKATELLIQAVKEEESVVKKHDISVFFQDFGDNSLNFEVFFWILLRDIVDKSRITSKIRYKIDKLYRDAGIVIAFPQRDVHLYQQKPLEVQIRNQ